MRGQGEGHYYEDGPYFCWRLKLAGRSDIVRKAKTAKELKAKVRQALRDLEDGGIQPSKEQRDLTVAAYLASWLANFVKTGRAMKTYRQYEQITRLYIVPSIGKVKLRDLTTLQCQAMLNKMQGELLMPEEKRRSLESKVPRLKALAVRGATEGERMAAMEGLERIQSALAVGRDERRVLAPATKATTRTVLKRALKMAVMQRLITFNPMDATEKPKAGPPKKRTMTPEDMQAAMSYLHQSRYGPLIGILLTTGLRISEALGLIWLDIDKRALPKPTLKVDRKLEWLKGGAWQFAEVKRPKSRRLIPLSTVAMGFLAQQLDTQSNDMAKAGDHYTDLGLVFSTEVGTPLIERNVQRALDAILVHAGLKHYSLHDLRRSFGTMLAKQNVPPHVLQALYGHENIQTTMHHYISAFSDSMASAVEVISFTPAIEKRKES